DQISKLKPYELEMMLRREKIAVEAGLKGANEQVSDREIQNKIRKHRRELNKEAKALGIQHPNPNIIKLQKQIEEAQKAKE
ncbi:MAG: hypothetical protein KDK69_00910, partial [Chlamydiia bacterium]|nr:hypothetical protein [Chlamydiia bacterium]